MIPNLLHYTGQAVVIDPKGENYAVTADYRKKLGQKVVVIDPFNVTDAPQKDSLNPLDLITNDQNSYSSIFDECSALTSMLVEPNLKADPFWDESAHELIAGLIAIVALYNPGNRDLMFTAKLMNWGEKDLKQYLDRLNKQFNDAFLGISSIFNKSETKVSQSILSVAKQHLRHLKTGDVAKAISSTSFSLLDFIAGKPMTIYIVLPPDKLHSHKKLLRIWVGTIIRLILKRPGSPTKPTLFMLDEAAQLGRLDELLQAITLLRGYGMQVWTFWQDINQIKGLYPNDWQTLLNNCRAIQAFGFPNLLACKEIAKITGYDDTDELLDLDRDEMLLQLAGDEAVIAQKANYLTDPVFSERAKDNPFHNEADAKGFVPINPQRVYIREKDPRIIAAKEKKRLAAKKSRKMPSRVNLRPKKTNTLRKRK